MLSEAAVRSSAADSSGSTPLLSLRSVGKTFSNGVTALSNVDLTIGEGDFVSLLGPSGCGKSTALRLIAGLSSPTSGQLRWHRQVGADAVGFVFQEPTLLPWASVFDNVWLPLRLKGRSRRDAAAEIEATLDRVGLLQFAHVYPRELSGGMKMRVSIARALVTEPKVLLMDEPFAALDEITRHKLNDDLLTLWEANRFTAVFVTHSVFESVYLSQRIVVMAARPGRVMSELMVDAPFPRDNLFRTSAEYAHLCRLGSDALKQAIEA